MTDLRDTLLEIERTLGGGTGDDYREHLTDDAVVVVPGAAIDREQTAFAIDSTPGWDEFEISEEKRRRADARHARCSPTAGAHAAATRPTRR